MGSMAVWTGGEWPSVQDWVMQVHRWDPEKEVHNPSKLITLEQMGT